MTDKELRLLLLDFQIYVRQSRLHGTYFAVNLRTIVLGWLATSTRPSVVNLQGLPPDQMAAVSEYIVSHYRTSWQAKAAETRAEKSKQLGPTARNDPRIGILI